VIELVLPFPPSVNHYWGTRVVRSGRRMIPQRYINAPGKAFRKTVIELCMVQRLRTLPGAIGCSVDLYPPNSARRDVDNFQKGVFDALGHAGVYADDSQIVEMIVRKHPKQPPGRTVVRLWEVDC